MRNSALKERLRSGRAVIGGWITLGHPAIGEIMAAAGFDWVAIDLEHSVITLEQAAALIAAIDGHGVAPLVRLTSNSAEQAKRLMDAGAHGIIVPAVNSVAEARHAVEIVRYGPAGTRGVGLARAQGYGARFAEYLQWQRSEPVVVVQIEHRAALAALGDILAVPGIDAYFVGPYDLSCSLGHPGDFAHPEFRAAMETIRQAGARSGLPGGLHIIEPEPAELRRALAEGHRFLAYSVDIRILDAGARAGAGLAREIS
jgi:2-keto-3-deoxy-L-rhamnonate aldolase RhmA